MLLRPRRALKTDVWRAALLKLCDVCVFLLPLLLVWGRGRAGGSERTVYLLCQRPCCPSSDDGGPPFRVAVAKPQSEQKTRSEAPVNAGCLLSRRPKTLSCSRGTPLQGCSRGPGACRQGLEQGALAPSLRCRGRCFLLRGCFCSRGMCCCFGFMGSCLVSAGRVGPGVSAAPPERQRLWPVLPLGSQGVSCSPASSGVAEQVAFAACS